MLVADDHLGHRSDHAIADRLADADPCRVVLSDTERRRSRVRTETTDGRDLGIVVGRELRDGDVLVAGDGSLVVVDLATVDALVLEFADADLAPTAALELGHALGNRHFDLALRDGEALFPVPDTRERMAGAVEDLVPAGVSYRFEAVPPTTFDDGTPAYDHSHGPPHDHSDGGVGHSHDDHPHSHSEDDHSHEDGHTHDGDHSHGDGHGHPHGAGHAHGTDSPTGDGDTG